MPLQWVFYPGMQRNLQILIERRSESLQMHRLNIISYVLLYRRILSRKLEKIMHSNMCLQSNMDRNASKLKLIT